MIVIKLKDIKLVSPNKSQHWSKRHKQNKMLRLLISLEFDKLPVKPIPPTTITINRISPRKLDSHDNLRMAGKGLVDIIADKLIPGQRPGFADGDERLKWVYLQTKGKPKEYSIEISFTE